MLVIPQNPVHILLFSQPGLKGNAKSYGNHPTEISDEKHVSIGEGVRAQKSGFHTHGFEYSCGLLTVRRISQVAQVQQ